MGYGGIPFLLYSQLQQSVNKKQGQVSLPLPPYGGLLNYPRPCSGVIPMIFIRDIPIADFILNAHAIQFV